MNNRDMHFWLLKNYIKLNEFMDIKLTPLKWEVGYKISHNLLNEEQKKLSNEFWNKAKSIELGNQN